MKRDALRGAQLYEFLAMIMLMFAVFFANFEPSEAAKERWQVLVDGGGVLVRAAHLEPSPSRLCSSGRCCKCRRS